jgi:hypothetical protein
MLNSVGPQDSCDTQTHAPLAARRPQTGAASLRRHGRICLGLLGIAVQGVAGCVVIHPSGTCGPSCDDIADAATIALSSQRLDVMNAICARRFLSQHEQYYAVNAIVGGRAGGAQSGPLITLIENPCCTPQTRRYISDRLPLITFSRERRRVAEMLSQTDTANPPPGPLPPDRPATTED